MKRKGFFARLADLWRGIWGVRLNDAEARNAEAVYHNAITEHVSHHQKLKEAVARLVYLRNRIEADTQQGKEDLRVVEAALVKAVNANDDPRALSLMRKKRSLSAELERLETEYVRLNNQIDKAKQGLQEVGVAIRRLKEERGEMLARKAHALARRDAQSVLQRLSETNHLLGSMTALENVRESIERLEQEADIEDETPQLPGEVSIRELRRQAQEEADQEALAALKEQLGGHLIVETNPTTELPGGNGKTLGPVAESTPVEATL